MKTPREQLRAAVIGYGSIGRRHFENLAALGVTRRLVVRRRARANPAFTPPSETPVVHSHEEAIAAGIDLAVICTPTGLHVETARQYLSAGISVLIEKPLCAPGQQQAAEQLVELAQRQSGTVASMAYCMRYHPAYRLAKETVTSGRIGKVLYAKAWFESYLPDWHPWEDYHDSYAARPDLGGGVLPTLDHEIDYLNWCLGQPEEVVCRAINSGSLNLDVPDHATLLFRYPRGVTATASLSFCRRDRCRGFEFIGSDGTLRFVMEQAMLELLSANDASATLWHDPEYGLNRMYLDLLDDYLTAVQSKSPPPVPLVDSLKWPSA